MVAMGRAGNPPIFTLDFVNRLWQIANTSMEVVGRAQKQDWARNVLEIDIVRYCVLEKRVFVVDLAIAYPSAGWRGGLDTRIGSGC